MRSPVDFCTISETEATDPCTATNHQGVQSQTYHQRDAILDTDPNLDLMRMDEVAAILQCNPATAYRLASNRMLPSIHLGRLVRVRRVDLSAFIQANIRPVRTHGG